MGTVQPKSCRSNIKKSKKYLFLQPWKLACTLPVHVHLNFLMVIRRVTDTILMSLISFLTLTTWLKRLNNGQLWAIYLIFDLDPGPEKKTPASSWFGHKSENWVAADFGHFALFWGFHAWDWLLDQNVLNCDVKMVTVTWQIIIICLSFWWLHRNFQVRIFLLGPLSVCLGWEISGHLHGFFQKIACLAKWGSEVYRR